MCCNRFRQLKNFAVVFAIVFFYTNLVSIIFLFTDNSYAKPDSKLISGNKGTFNDTLRIPFFSKGENCRGAFAESLSRAILLLEGRSIPADDIEILKGLITVASQGVKEYLKEQFDQGKIPEADYLKGIRNIPVSLADWVSDPYKKDTTKEGIRKAIESERWADIAFAYFDNLAFGTAGLRAQFAMGEDFDLMVEMSKEEKGLQAPILKGPNTINDEVLGCFVAGAIKWAIEAKQRRSEEASSVKIGIGYDSRIAGREFAELAKKIGLSYGIQVYFADEVMPLPEFSCATSAL